MESRRIVAWWEGWLAAVAAVAAAERIEFGFDDWGEWGEWGAAVLGRRGGPGRGEECEALRNACSGQVLRREPFL